MKKNFTSSKKKIWLVYIQNTENKIMSQNLNIFPYSKIKDFIIYLGN